MDKVVHHQVQGRPIPTPNLQAV